MVPWLLAGCKKSEQAIGASVVQSGSRVVYVDYLDVRFSTVQYDTLVTQSRQSLLVGSMASDPLGQVQVGTYISLGLATQRIQGEDLMFDSAMFYLNPSGKVWGDSLYTTTVDVYRVLEAIDPAAKDSFACETTPLGSFEHLVKPANKGRVAMRLPDALGSELYDYLRKDVLPGVQQDNLTDHFHGLYLRPGAASKSVVDYLINDTSANIIIYYHAPMSDKSQNLRLSVSRVHNYTQTDGSNRVISGLEQKKNLPAHSMGQQGLLHNGLKLATRVDFPNLRDYFLGTPNIQIIRAELQVCPTKAVNRYTMPRELYTFYVNGDNQKISQVINPAAGGPANGNLVVDNIFFNQPSTRGT